MWTKSLGLATPGVCDTRCLSGTEAKLTVRGIMYLADEAECG